MVLGRHELRLRLRDELVCLFIRVTVETTLIQLEKYRRLGLLSQSLIVKNSRTFEERVEEGSSFFRL